MQDGLAGWPGRSTTDMFVDAIYCELWKVMSTQDICYCQKFEFLLLLLLLSALSRRRREVIHVIFACAILTFIKSISVKQ